jgi:hypothetical protein
MACYRDRFTFKPKYLAKTPAPELLFLQHIPKWVQRVLVNLENANRILEYRARMTLVLKYLGRPKVK